MKNNSGIFQRIHDDLLINKPLLTVFFFFLIPGNFWLPVISATSKNEPGLSVFGSTTLPSDTDFDFNFDILTEDGSKVSAAKFRGKTVFVNLWASWCGPCRAEMPSINALYQELDTANYAFLMLSIDKKQAFPKANQFAKTNGFAFPIYFSTGELPPLLRVDAIPATFVVNREGKVVYQKKGGANYNTKKFRNFMLSLH